MRVPLKSFLLIVIAAGAARAANDVPDWVKDAAARKAPDFPARVTGVVLFQEEFVSVDADGRRVMRERGVVRVLQPGGETISATRTYNNKSGRIRDFQGWLIPPSGKPTFYGKERIIDTAVSDGVYEELRVKVLECGKTP